MAKGNGCTRKLIKFKTKRGRWVTFHGAPGGSKKSGGKCSSPGAGHSHSAAATHARKMFAKAARKCRGGTVKSRSSCVKSHLRHPHKLW